MKKSVLLGILVIAVGVVLWGGLRGSDLLATKNHEKKSSGVPLSSCGAGGLDEAVKSVQSVEGLVYSEEQLSPPVKTLLGLDGEKQNYDSLEDAIAKLSKDLGADDLAALRDMLTWPNDKFPEGMRPIEINAVKNDILDRLLRQNELPEGIGVQMVEMASNPDNDPVWRDYCVQFMQPFYERFAAERMAHGAGSGATEYAENAEKGEIGLATKNHEGEFDESSESSSAAGGENDVDELGAVREAMFSALDERGSTIAGTSLIGLELLSRGHDEFDRDAIAAKAVEIAADESASPVSRMTAMRLSAQISNNEQGISNDEVAETARLIAQTGETVLLRSAAIVTLGEVGTDADRELLESYTQDGNQQIADAARLALKKMDSGQNLPPAPVNQIIGSQTTTTPQSTQKLPPVLIN